MEESKIVALNGQELTKQDLMVETVEEVLERFKENCPESDKVFIIATNSEGSGDIYTFSNIADAREVYWYMSIIMHETLAR